MKHIVVLVGSYHPNYSAVGICARNIVDELKKQAYVSVIAQKTDINDVNHIYFEGYDLYRISTFIHSKYLQYREKFKLYYGIKKIIYHFMFNLVRGYNHIRALLQEVNIKWEFIRAYQSKLEEIEKEKHIDAIICFCFPFETIIAGQRFKDPPLFFKFTYSIKHILYHLFSYKVPVFFPP